MESYTILDMFLTKANPDAAPDGAEAILRARLLTHGFAVG